MVTLMATIYHKRVTTWYLDVTVSTDRFGCLVVYDYQTIVAGPARAEVETPTVQALPPDREDELGSLFGEFFPVWLGGEGDLSRFAPPDEHLQALPERYRLDSVNSITPVAGTNDVVLVE